MFFNHLYELHWRFFYILLSWFASFVLWFSFLPDLFLLAPFTFLHYQWDDTLWAFFVIAALAAFVSSAPFFLWHLYLFFKPALLSFELSLFKALVLWSACLGTACLFIAPFLLFHLPYFLLSFHSDSLFFAPNFYAVSGFLEELIFAFVAIWSIPAFLWFRFSRHFIYSFILLFAAFFADSFSFLIVFFPLLALVELSCFLVFLLRNFIASAFSS